MLSENTPSLGAPYIMNIFRLSRRGDYARDRHSLNIIAQSSKLKGESSAAGAMPGQRSMPKVPKAWLCHILLGELGVLEF